MRRILITRHGRPHDMSIADCAAPTPGANEVKIATHAIGLNYPDLLVIAGTYQNIPPLPYSPGKEAAGVVLEVGPGVERVKPGDRVMIQVENGAYAEQIIAREQHCVVLPNTVAMQTAAGLGLVYTTAWFGLIDRGRFKPAETVLISGAAGGCGIAAVQITKALGGKAIALVSTAEKAEFVKRNGADAAIVVSADDTADDLRDRVRDANDGRGVDVFFDPVGGDVFDAGLRCLAWDGRAVVVGFTSGRPNLVRSNYLLIKHITVSGLHASDYRDCQPELMRDANERLLRLVEQGKLAPPISATYPFDQFAEALQEIAERRVQGKLVLLTDLGRQQSESAGSRG